MMHKTLIIVIISILYCIPTSYAKLSHKEAKKKVICGSTFMYHYSRSTRACYLSMAKHVCGKKGAKLTKNYTPKHMHHCPQLYQHVQMDTGKKLKKSLPFLVKLPCLPLVFNKAQIKKDFNYYKTFTCKLKKYQLREKKRQRALKKKKRQSKIAHKQ